VRRAACLQREIAAAYEDYEFHRVYQLLHNFCVVDLGGFYLDVVKDRLYTTPAGGRPRRSAQTAMCHLAEAMVRWFAPILSFTAEEIWQYLPGRRRASVLMATWHEFPEIPPTRVDWDTVLAVRETVSGADIRRRGSVRSAFGPRWGTAFRIHHLGR
jgi:isoleucyl-tRNA synthetase